MLKPSAIIANTAIAVLGIVSASFDSWILSEVFSYAFFVVLCADAVLAVKLPRSGFPMGLASALLMTLFGVSAMFGSMMGGSGPVWVSKAAAVLLLSGWVLDFTFPRGSKKTAERTASSVPLPEDSAKQRGSTVSLILLAAVLVLGSLYTAVLCTRFGGDLIVQRTFLPNFVVFLAFTFLFAGTSLFRSVKHKGLKWGVLVWGVGIFALCLLPLVTTLGVDSDRAFAEAFGFEPDSVRGSRPAKVSMADLLFGVETSPHEILEHVVFLDEAESGGVKLHYDAYFPETRDEPLPVLVRIHGGAWVIGDKGYSNMKQMNTYFAALGYAVFDVQYGLSNKGTFAIQTGAPEYVRGDFSIDDMVSHIKAFLHHLETRKDEYGLDVGRVFVSGGSAGGQLSLAVGLSPSSGSYPDVVPESMTIRGIVRFYPANGLAVYVGIEGSQNLVDPSLLVTAGSPPCLVYQGDLDLLVNPSVSQALKTAYSENGNTRCMVVPLPFGTHGGDIVFSGVHNQLFLYYMELFIGHY